MKEQLLILPTADIMRKFNSQIHSTGLSPTDVNMVLLVSHAFEVAKLPHHRNPRMSEMQTLLEREANRFFNDFSQQFGSAISDQLITGFVNFCGDLFLVMRSVTNYTPTQKVPIILKHFFDGVQIIAIVDDYEVNGCVTI